MAEVKALHRPGDRICETSWLPVLVPERRPRPALLAVLLGLATMLTAEAVGIIVAGALTFAHVPLATMAGTLVAIAYRWIVRAG